MATIVIGSRPLSLDGCFASWSESFKANTIRTESEATGYVKVRRRTTGKTTMIECSLTLPADKYDDFIDWYFISCQAGVLPTRIKRPQDGKEIVVRFTEPPSISWPDKVAFSASVKFEQLPAWITL